jgi:hypothetical protein
VAEPVEATGMLAGSGPFDELRGLATQVAEPVEATGMLAGSGPFDELRGLATQVAELVEATGMLAGRPGSTASGISSLTPRRERGFL